jgi:four helix bundle protein
MENDFTKSVSFFRFEDLRVYHKALDYIDWVANTTQMFSEHHSGSLAARFNAAAQSIAFYIAEGSSRNKNQFIHYLKQAKSSLRECVIMTSLLEKQGFLSEQMVEYSRNQLIELTKMIGALIGSLQKANKKYNHYNNHTGHEGEEELELADQYNASKY